MNQYVCAFRGRRDSYQVPRALAEANQLDQFITDFYGLEIFQKSAPFLPAALRSKVLFRSEPGVPAAKVKCLWGTTLLEHGRHALGFSPSVTFSQLDQQFAYSAAARARQMKSDLLLYTPYAWEAFTASYRHQPRKVLFEYHPHPEFQTRVLSEDLKKHPLVRQSYQEETGAHLPARLQARINDSWKYADLILCASSFTRHTLLAAGAAPESCAVVPYGIDLPPEAAAHQTNSFQALFVGSGVQRKGLHHLLYAWRQARLPQDSRLTLVCRHFDPGLASLINETPNVRLMRGASTEEVQRLYEDNSLFVMPSLVEGFGQVFLEALSYGCPVLGTNNTCLPDLGDEEDGIFLTDAANIDQLASKLETLAPQLTANIDVRRKARACAEKFPWQNFRDGLIEALRNETQAGAVCVTRQS